MTWSWFRQSINYKMAIAQCKSSTPIPIHLPSTKGQYLHLPKNLHPEKSTRSTRCLCNTYFFLPKPRCQKWSTYRSNLKKCPQWKGDATRQPRPASNQSGDETMTRCSSCGNSGSWTSQWMMTNATRSWNKWENALLTSKNTLCKTVFGNKSPHYCTS